VNQPNPRLSREELALAYLEQLPFVPYPVQERALLAWFETTEGILVSAPTGTGKTLIAEAAVYEALRTGRRMYYTTPLIALTEQKFRELTESVVRWGGTPEQVGLVTGNRRVNPQAPILVVVAEILLNRLLQGPLEEFDGVDAVVMDEFHSFSDPERGIVWEFSLSLLPPHVRLMLLSATVGNAVEFLGWLKTCHGRNLDLIQGQERKVPLNFRWVGDQTLNELLEEMADGPPDLRLTPALVFCFSRDECWGVAEELKGRSLLESGQQKALAAELAKHDFRHGAGPKLKQILMRGIGVHHAGVLPRFRRIVEDLFQKRLLTVCLCTETLSAGINLPARSVVLPSLMKGPPTKLKLIEPSSAHQIFGRAGRPQFDDQGHVLALAHEDDVRILRWRQKYDAIPENTRDPGLLAARKMLKRKQPTRNPNRQYWNEAQFTKLITASPGRLTSQGHLPWRMLAYMLQLSPEVERLRHLVRKRLMDPKRVEQEQRMLHSMLLTLHAAGVVELDPPPPSVSAEPEKPAQKSQRPAQSTGSGNMGSLLIKAVQAERLARGETPIPGIPDPDAEAPVYTPVTARPTERLREFFAFRSVNPVFGLFLLQQFDLANEAERLQLLEAVLNLPGSLLRHVRVPNPERLPPGPLARERIDLAVVARGLLPAGDLYPPFDPEARPEERKWPPPLADKVRMVFDSEYPGVHGVFLTPVWVVADLLQFGGHFHRYVSGRDLSRHEGLIFRHLLRFILLLGEFSAMTPAGIEGDEWRAWLEEIASQLTQSCAEVDPQSTDQALTQLPDNDFLPGDLVAKPQLNLKRGAATTMPAPRREPPPDLAEPEDDFAAGVEGN
jgi:superfamily II DNA/RNA helicase